MATHDTAARGEHRTPRAPRDARDPRDPRAPRAARAPRVVHVWCTGSTCGARVVHGETCATYWESAEWRCTWGEHADRIVRITPKRRATTKTKHTLCFSSRCSYPHDPSHTHLLEAHLVTSRNSRPPDCRLPSISVLDFLRHVDRL